MTYTHVADFGSGASSFSLTTHTIGNILLCQVQNGTSGSHPNGLSSSNVTWTLLGTLFTGTTNSALTAQCWLGVATAASTATLTATFSGASSGVIVGGMEFSSTTGTPVLDVQGHIDSAGTNTWASLTPAQSGELYWGVAENSSNASSGTTSGYVYNASIDTHGNGQAYNLNCTGGVATAPVWGDSTEQFGIMVLVAPPAAATPAPFYPVNQAVRARFLAPGLPRSGSVSSELRPGTGNIPGPVTGAGRGSGQGASGAPVANPQAGPVFRQAVQAVRGRLPLTLQRKQSASGGHIRFGVKAAAYTGQANAGCAAGFAARQVFASYGAPVANPQPGPVFSQAVQAVRARLPQQPVLRGRSYSGAGGPVQNPQPGPVFRPFTQAVRARLPLQPVLRGRTGSNAGSIAAKVTPAPFWQQPCPVRARIPRNAPRGRVYSNPGGPVLNANVIAVYGAIPGPVRASLPVLSAGRITRIASSAGIPVPPPATPAPFVPQRIVRARLAPVQPYGYASAMVAIPVPANPVSGPAFRQAVIPVQARRPLPPRGRVASNPGGPVQNPVPGITGPPFYPLHWPARARIPQNAPRGRTLSSPGAPVRNPSQGPVFRQAVQAVRARLPLQPFLKGRCSSSPGGPVVNPPPPGVSSGQPAGIRVIFLYAGRTHPSPPYAPPHNPPPPVSGPAIPPRSQAVRAQVPPLPPFGRAATMVALPVPSNPSRGPASRQATSPVRASGTLPPRGRAASSQGGPAQNPSPAGTGPVFVPRHDPARIRPSLPPRGRTSGSPGGPVQNPPPPVAGPAIPPRSQAVRAKIPPQPPFGRAATMVALPVPANPAQGPAFRQADSPARIRPSLPPRGRVSGNPGGPVQNPPPPVAGPVFFPFRQAVHIRFALPPRGRTAGGQGAPVRNPRPGAAFPAWHGPAQARQPLPPRGGRAAANPGGPVRNPGPAGTGPPIPPRSQAVQARIPLPGPNGSGRAATMVALLAPPATGPVFRQATQPVQARRLPPAYGRVYSNPGSVPPPQPPPPGWPMGQPTGIRVVYLATGRCRSTPAYAAPVPPHVQGPVFVPRHDPARIRPSLPPRGRAQGGRGAPVRNPHPGPVFRQAVRPARTPVPQNAPRGRAASNPGGPVQNIPVATLLFRLGNPCFQWDTGAPGLVSDWAAGSPASGWDTGVPETSS